jgi:rare lipoprotein A
MKKKYFIYLVFSLCLFSCARDRVHIPDSVHTQTIVLSKKAGEKASRPYIVNGARYYPLPDSYGFVQFGEASWYGREFHGRATASGEIYDMHNYTAAHKILPLGTHVRVQNLINNKHVIVRINDRGPFVKGRIIDLSYAAAKDLQLIGPGVADVKIVALGKEVGRSRSKKGGKPIVEFQDLERGEFTIQIGAFENRDNATRLASRLKVIFEYVTISEYTDNERRTLYKVYVSKSQSLTQAGEMEKKLEDMGFTEAFIVRI